MKAKRQPRRSRRIPTFTFQLRPELRERLLAIAERDQVSLSRIIEKACFLYIEARDVPKEAPHEQA